MTTRNIWSSTVHAVPAHCAEQRESPSDVFNTTDLWTVPQISLYKEVQNLANMSLRVPDAVPLLGTYDNWGHIQRLPSDTERSINFQVGYVGDPMDSKWINTINNARFLSVTHLAV